ncbi:proteasome assembly chaperone 2 isoform X2 [Heptranchias perlo]|uniref:proteasome assembly chaperone 2 isoform X2 n=1 Tax=Heptranchias perlo TaxID=212740 RepID=UPI0035594CD4
MDTVFVPSGTSRANLKGYTLIMPVVSVGNVGQLTIDLIISTLGLPRVGYIHSDCLLPVVGNNPYTTTSENSAEMCISSEVYASADQKLAVLQIRSPIVQGKHRSFRQQLFSWFKESEFSRIVVLSSSHAHHRVDRQLVGMHSSNSPRLLRQHLPNPRPLPPRWTRAAGTWEHHHLHVPLQVTHHPNLEIYLRSFIVAGSKSWNSFPNSTVGEPSPHGLQRFKKAAHHHLLKGN